MTECFQIRSDVARSLLRISMTGFWSERDVFDFIAAEQAAAAALPCKKGEHLVLADLSDLKIQSQATVALFQDFIRTPTLRSRKLAMVGGKGIAWMQIRRMMVRESIAAFADINSAEFWLFANDNCCIDYAGAWLQSRCH